MVDVRGDVLRPLHCTTPAALKANKNKKWVPLRAIKTFIRKKTRPGQACLLCLGPWICKTRDRRIATHSHTEWFYFHLQKWANILSMTSAACLSFMTKPCSNRLKQRRNYLFLFLRVLIKSRQCENATKRTIGAKKNWPQTILKTPKSMC